MANNCLSQRALGRTASLWLVLAGTLVAAMLFLSAGTVRYWEAWVYLSILFITASLMLAYLLKYSPSLLERRMRMREKEPQQRWIVGLSWLWFVITFLVPGFDHRWNGTAVPALAVIIADLFVLLGYGVTFWVFRTNPYASRIVEVAPDQQVVSIGPYAVVRHPMYLGAALIYLATPLALGSFWGCVPAVFILPIMVARIHNEEDVLARDLLGYRDYVLSTRYRLLPGIW